MEQLYGVAIVPLLVAIVELLKRTGMNGKYAGILSLALGVGVGLAYGLTEGGWTILQSLVVGAGIGLSASGLYSSVKSTNEAVISRGPQDGGDLGE